MLEGMLAVRSGRNMLDLTTWGPAYYEKHALPYPFTYVTDDHAELIETQTPYGLDVAYKVTTNQYDFTNPGYVGGWNTDINFADIDRTKRYRFSVWLYIDNKFGDTGNSFYLGCNHSQALHSVVRSVDGVTESNPYFVVSSSASLPQKEWLLAVGYVNPSGTIKATVDSAIYRQNGDKLPVGYLSAEYSWGPNCSKAMHRTYSYYGTRAGVDQAFYHPRIEICDGSEPSITELLNRRID